MKAFIHLISNLDVVVHLDTTGGYYAVVPALPGCGSQGESIEETLENLDDAIMTVLDVLKEDDPDRLQQICGATTSYTGDIESDATGSIVEIRSFDSIISA